MSADVEVTLAARAQTYGDFKDIAYLSQSMQAIMRRARNWEALPNDMREALQTIASKIARILNGDPEYLDSWHDIAGYARLVENRLREGGGSAPPAPSPPTLPGTHLAVHASMPPDGIEVAYSPAPVYPDHPWLACFVADRTKLRRGTTRDEAVAKLLEAR